MNATSNILAEIYEARRRANVHAREPLDALEQQAAAQRRHRRSLLAALKRANSVGIIGEVKFASPSRGTIVQNRDPAAIAARLERAGVDAISVVTEEHFFGGGLEMLLQVREVTHVPLLRKDFLSSSYDVVQSAAYGADAVLLIVTALSDDDIRRLSQEAQRCGLEVLLEVHDESEVRRALSLAPRMIGINNRDLRTFDVSLRVSTDLLKAIPAGVLTISESGLSTPSQVREVTRDGARACLIGEALLRATEPGRFTAACRSAIVR